MKAKHHSILAIILGALCAVFAAVAYQSAVALESAFTDYQDFDQTPGKGWRALAENQKRFVAAARLIEAYLGEHSELHERNRANLHFHAAQCLAFEGSPANIAAALAHLGDAHVNPEPPDLPMCWNDYVTATEAFLKGDLPELKAARERIAAGPKMNGEIANLDVVDRLIAKFGKSYGEAYGMKTGAEEKEAAVEKGVGNAEKAAEGAKSPAPAPVDDATAGVGVMLVSRDGHFHVGDLLPDSAALASQLIHSGDRILAVGEGEREAQSLAGKSMAEAAAMIRGKAGTSVRLTVVSTENADSTAREVLLTRGKLLPALGLYFDGGALQPGTQAPELPYMCLGNGKMTSLAARHHGKIVVLGFWATWCGPCHHAMDDLQKTAAKFADRKDKIDFLTISIDGNDEQDLSKIPAAIDKAVALLKQKSWTQTINGWSGLEELKEWKVRAVPTTYLIDIDGKVIIANPKQKLEDVIAPLLAR